MHVAGKVALAVCFFILIVYMMMFVGQYTFTSTTVIPPVPQKENGQDNLIKMELLNYIKDYLKKDPASTSQRLGTGAERTVAPSIPVVPVRKSDWKIIRPTYNMSEAVLHTDWWNAASFLELDFRMRPIDYNCKNFSAEGNWYVCFDGKFNMRRPCLVYSFGIGHDFSFDDDMASLGCEVHSFDPSMGVPDHTRPSSVHFHNIGLGGKVLENFNPRQDIYVQEKQKWTIMTLGTIMAALGHSDRDLDVLKIDVEGHEWSVIEYLLTSPILPRIKQFALEYHLFPDWPPKSQYPRCLSTYKNLSDKGFRKFFTGLHPLQHTPESFNIQADVGYVNTRYKPTIRRLQ